MSESNPAPSDSVVTVPLRYHPSYNTLAALFQDSYAVFGGSLTPYNAATGNAYFFNVDRYFAGSALYDNGNAGVSPGQFAAMHLQVGVEYVVFYAADSTANNERCIVGGLRGIFALNTSTNTVARLDSSPTSQIPRLQTLASFTAQISALVKASAEEAATNKVAIIREAPVCSMSATGLPS